MKRITKKVKAWLLLFILSFMIFVQNSTVSEAVTPSNKDYTVLLNGPRYFIHNKETAGSAAGTEYYMTYTVKSVAQVPTQHGLIGTDDYTRNFPYTEGGLMRYAGSGQDLLTEGYTYFIKFTVAKGGFRYSITRAKGNEIEDITLDKFTGDATCKMGYFGIWLAYSAVEAELADVRFYDAKGKDLGVKLETPTKTGLVLEGGIGLQKDTKVDHRYDVSITNGRNIAISNLRVPTTKRFYIEYKVDSAEYVLNQEGIAMSNEPKSDYPHRNGILKYVTYPEPAKAVNLLEVGAEYILMIDCQKDAFNVLVQKSSMGKTTYSMLTNSSGKYSSDFGFASLWFGAGSDTTATFKLVNMKFYDENKNNLGIQTNVTSTIMHYGEMEDYAGCEAVYYCKENGNLMALYEDQTMKHTMGLITDKATYKISENVMRAEYAAETKSYDYLYRRIVDADKNAYERLYYYKLSFVTGTEETIDTQELSNEKGYYAMQPTDPVMEGYEFKGWCTSDGKEFDFKQIVTESDTLYAKWSGDGGVTFLASENIKTGMDMTYILFGAGILAILVGVTVSVMFIKRGLKNESK